MNPGAGATIIWRCVESTSSWSRQLPCHEPENRETGTENGTGHEQRVRQVDDASGMTLLVVIPSRMRSFFLPEGLYSWHLASFYLPGSLICQALAWCRLSVDRYAIHTAVYTLLHDANCFARRSPLDIFKNYRPRSAIINNPPFDLSGPATEKLFVDTNKSCVTQLHPLAVYENYSARW